MKNFDQDPGFSMNDPDEFLAVDAELEAKRQQIYEVLPRVLSMMEGQGIDIDPVAELETMNPTEDSDEETIERANKAFDLHSAAMTISTFMTFRDASRIDGLTDGIVEEGLRENKEAIFADIVFGKSSLDALERTQLVAVLDEIVPGEVDVNAARVRYEKSQQNIPSFFKFDDQRVRRKTALTF